MPSQSFINHKQHYQPSSAETLLKFKELDALASQFSNSDIRNFIASNQRFRDAAASLMIDRADSVSDDRRVLAWGSDRKKWTSLLHKHPGMHQFFEEWRLEKNLGNQDSIKAQGRTAFWRDKTQEKKMKKKREKRMKMVKQARNVRWKQRKGIVREEKGDEEGSEPEPDERKIRESKVSGWLNETNQD